MFRQLSTVTLLALALYAAGARAGETNASMFSFSGFGTFGVVHSSEHRADFTSSRLKPNGAGFSRNWSADVDSLIGGQVSAKFTPELSAVVQVIAEQNDDNSYRPHVEWANLQYQITPDWSVRVGRTVLPTFLYSGTRKVGYTYPWVRPPLEVYRLVPVTASDGVDTSFRKHLGGFTHTVQANYGSGEQKLPGASTIKAERAWGITYSVEYHNTTVHAAFQRARLTLDSVKPIFDGFRQFGPTGVALANRYELENRPLSILELGATYDPGQWFMTAEWTHTRIRSFLGNGTGWYVSSGYRFGKFTPYLMYAQASANNLSDPGLELSTLPPPLVGPATGLNAALNALLGGKVIQKTVSLGGRWELARDVALKLQYDRSNIGAGSTGVLSNLQPGFQPGGKVSVVSATIDVVF